MTKQTIVGATAVALPATVAGVFLVVTPTPLRAASGCYNAGLYYSHGACIQDDCTMEVWHCDNGSWNMGCG